MNWFAATEDVNNMDMYFQKDHLKGQVALEMLLIIIFLFITLLPLVFYMYSILTEEAWRVDIQHIQSVAVKIVEYADKLSAGGDGATTQISLYFPSKVINVTTNGTILAISAEVPILGVIDQVAIAKQPLVLLPDEAAWNGISGMQRIYFNYSVGAGGTGKVYIYRECSLTESC